MRVRRRTSRGCKAMAVVLALGSAGNAGAQTGHVQGSPAHGAPKLPGTAAASTPSSAADASYQCPMKCGGGKIYSQPGKCPVCSMALKKITAAKYTVEVKPSQGLRAGSVVTLGISIKDPDGKPVKNLETVHEKILHLLVVSKDLSWYAHEHPKMKADGTLELVLTFPAPGTYMLYHDFSPPGVGQQVVRAAVDVPGIPAATVPLVVDSAAEKLVDGYTFAFSTKAPLRAGEEAEIVFRVTKDGKPVTDLQSYLGALGHLVVISEDLEQFVHSHPLEAASNGPDVGFQAHFIAPGVYKAWAQFQHRDKILTVPVVMQVAAAPVQPRVPAHQH